MELRFLLIFAIFIATIEAIAAESMFGPGFPFNNDFGAQMRRHMDERMGLMRRNMDNMLGQMKHRQDIMGAQFYDSMNKLQQQMSDMNSKFEATRMISAMLRGTGGSTWISYNGNNVLVENNRMIGCQGPIVRNENGFVCGGTVVGVNNVCVPGSKSYTQLNDKFCVFDDDSTTHSAYIVNEHVVCEHGFLYTQYELQQQCGPNLLNAHYAHVIYTPNLKDPLHVPIPTNNPYLNCGSSDVCEFDSNFSGFVNFF